MGETVGASQSKLKLEIVLRMANRVFQLAVKTQRVYNSAFPSFVQPSFPELISKGHKSLFLCACLRESAGKSQTGSHPVFGSPRLFQEQGLNFSNSGGALIFSFVDICLWSLMFELLAILRFKNFSQSEDISCFGRETRWLCPLFPKQEDQSRGEWSTNKLPPPISLLRLSLPFCDCGYFSFLFVCISFLCFVYFPRLQMDEIFRHNQT